MELVEINDNGLYCPIGDFYIDPWKPVSRAVVTHAHGDHLRSGSKEYFVSELSRNVTDHRIRSDNYQLKAYDYEDSFELGGVTVSFHPAGHVLGSAQVRMEYKGVVWVVSGDYKRAVDPTCKSFEPVECDVFITEATFGIPVYRWLPGAEIVQSIYEWWQQNASENRTSVLFSYSLGKTQRLLAELAALTNDTVFIHGAHDAITEIYRKEGIEMLPTEKVADQDPKKKYDEDLVLAPPSAHRSRWMHRFKNSETAFASGHVRVRGRRRMGGYDRGFVISDHADWPGLVQTVKETKANEVQVAYTKSPAFVRYLVEEMDLEAKQLDTYGYSGEDD